MSTQHIYALVCGCNYENCSWRVYQSYNDAVKFYNILVDVYKVPLCNIRTLYNSEYTKANILKELKFLASKMDSPDITGIVYTAGHGTQTRDSNGDEKDGYDENWQTYDHQNLVDDEVTKIFETTHIKSNLTVVSDSCHSGSMLDIEDNKYIDRSWVSLGSAMDNQSAIQSGDGSVCSVSLFKILLDEPKIKIGCLKDKLEEEMKNSFIGDMQTCVLSVSNSDLLDKEIFTHL